MVVYAVLIGLNLLGMGFLFYIYEQQKIVNTEFLKNAILHNAVLEVLKEKTDELEKLIKDLFISIELYSFKLFLSITIYRVIL